MLATVSIIYHCVITLKLDGLKQQFINTQFYGLNIWEWLGFWLVIYYEVAGRCWFGLQSSEGLSGPGRFLSKVAYSCVRHWLQQETFVPSYMALFIQCLNDMELACPRGRDPRNQTGRGDVSNQSMLLVTNSVQKEPIQKYKSWEVRIIGDHLGNWLPQLLLLVFTSVPIKYIHI